MRKTIDIRGRIAVRAYYLWLNGSGECSALDDWAFAEAFENALVERRAVSATKAAATRRAKGFYEKVAQPAAAEMLVAAKGRPASYRPTAH